jgi:hypothetical protein
MHYYSTPEGKDPHLWSLAQKRVAFRNHLAVYVVMNLFFWALWFFTGAHMREGKILPWPVWPMLGWGIGIVFHFIGAYVNTGNNSLEREYEKLKNQNK